MEIKIHSLIEEIGDNGLSEGEPEISITSTEAEYSEIDGVSVFSYNEEQGGEKIKTKIYLNSDGSVRLQRSGAIVWDVTMREGETVSALYSIPPYSFDSEVTPRRVTASREGEKYEIRLVYSMAVGGAKKDVKMRISVR